MTDPVYTPEQLAAVKDQVTPPPIGTGPADVTAKTAAGSPTEVDVNALLAQLQAQQAAMAAEIAKLRAGRAATGEHRLIADARVARDLIAQHFDNGYRGNRADVLRLADDTVDAAVNAVQSGDTTAVRQVTGRLARALRAIHPGPGDHHYFRNALDFAEYHLPSAADEVTEPAPSSAAAVGSGKPPATVIAGSVTG